MDCLVSIVAQPVGFFCLSVLISYSIRMEWVFSHHGQTTVQDVRVKILGLMQSWASAFKSRSDLSYVAETVSSLRAQGYSFPPAEKTEAIMIDTSAVGFFCCRSDCYLVAFDTL